MLPPGGPPTVAYCGCISLLPGSPGLFDGDETLRSLRAQSDACAALGSPMYARLFAELADDYAWGGRTYALLAGRSDRPIHDALPLRLAGAIHRVVLRGDDPRLAAHYPTASGSPGDDFPADFIGYMREHLAEVEDGLASQVQTNEVGRSVVPLAVSHWMTSHGITEYEHLEIGASAGLNLNFDRYYAGVRTLRMGDPGSPLRFGGDWFDGMPSVPRTAARVVRRRGVDTSPIDVSDPAQRLRLLSFVWPDQRQRFERIGTALDIAAVHVPQVDTGSADDWVAARLAGHRDSATVVFHSIVWQYLGRQVQDRLRRTLEEAGTATTGSPPLLWVRMEPAGAVADVRVTMWARGERSEHRLAEIGYHGQQMRWLA